MRRRNLRGTGPEWLLVKRGDRSTVSIKYRADQRSPWKWGSSGETTKKAAGKVAAKLVMMWLSDNEREVHNWKQFRERYEAEQLPSWAPKTQEAFRTAANRLESLLTIRYVEDLDEEKFSQFASKLRSEGKSEATIGAYRDHLLMALKWAKSVKIIDRKPNPPSLKRGKRKTGDKSRGRALSREEAERIAAKLPTVVGDEVAKLWAWNLECLWRSGMRIKETYHLTWSQSETHYLTDIDDHRPLLVINAGFEKGNRDRKIPLTPDFVHFLREVPKAERRGRVIRWLGVKGWEVTDKTVEKRIAKAGKLAGVVVGTRVDGTSQHATAHDFRRSFAARWAPRVMPVILQDLMRHDSIETTMKYYVGLNAQRNAEALWSDDIRKDTDFGAKLGDILDSLYSIED